MKTSHILKTITLYLLMTACIFLSSCGTRRPKWTITQYGSDEGRQRMFYTIQDSDNHLAVIDGGWTENAEEVLETIRALGGHVDTWIITHSHPDHVGAFNVIMSEPDHSGITVDRILTVPVHEDRYRETARDYDDFPSYTAFKSLTDTLSIPITYVSENDTYDLLGLNMKVISAWDDFVDTFENNLCNRGSMMFKLSGNEDSFLFCADVEEPMEARIIEKHRDELQADYVQLAHHGNWGLSDAFYEIVSPKAAFFDAPASIIDVTDASFDGWKLRDSLTQKGIKLYRFADAPNSITIH